MQCPSTTSVVVVVVVVDGRREPFRNASFSMAVDLIISLLLVGVARRAADRCPRKTLCSLVSLARNEEDEDEGENEDEEEGGKEGRKESDEIKTSQRRRRRRGLSK